MSTEYTIGYFSLNQRYKYVFERLAAGDHFSISYGGKIIGNLYPPAGENSLSAAATEKKPVIDFSDAARIARARSNQTKP